MLASVKSRQWRERAAPTIARRGVTHFAAVNHQRRRTASLFGPVVKQHSKLDAVYLISLVSVFSNFGVGSGNGMSAATAWLAPRAHRASSTAWRKLFYRASRSAPHSSLFTLKAGCETVKAAAGELNKHGWHSRGGCALCGGSDTASSAARSFSAMRQRGVHHFSNRGSCAFQRKALFSG